MLPRSSRPRRLSWASLSTVTTGRGRWGNRSIGSRQPRSRDSKVQKSSGASQTKPGSRTATARTRYTSTTGSRCEPGSKPCWRSTPTSRGSRCGGWATRTRPTGLLCGTHSRGLRKQVRGRDPVLSKGERMKVAVFGGGSSYTPELVKGFLDRRRQLPADGAVAGGHFAGAAGHRRRLRPAHGRSRGQPVQGAADDEPARGDRRVPATSPRSCAWAGWQRAARTSTWASGTG